MYYMILGGRSAVISQNIKAASATYELTYAAGYYDMFNGARVDNSLDCDIRWVAGMPNTSENNGYPDGARGSVGVSTKCYRSYGLWEVPTIK